MEKKISLAAASALITNEILEEVKTLPCIKRANAEELCGQTAQGELTFNFGVDVLGNTRFATVRVIIHRPDYNIDKFDEEMEEFKFKQEGKKKNVKV